MSDVTAAADVLAPNADVASLSPRLVAALRGNGCTVVPAGDAVLQVAWRGRPGWAHVSGWLLLPLLGLGAAIWRVRRTEACTLTLQADRAGVRIHLTGRLPEPARIAALAVINSPRPDDHPTREVGPRAMTSTDALVTSVPGRPSPPPAAPELPVEQTGWERDQHTVSAQVVRDLVAASAATFALDNGRTVAIGEFGLLGRDPAPAKGEEHAQLVAVPDATRTVSKTHLAFGTAGGPWVMDRHSTNGSAVVGRDGQRNACPPGVRIPVSAGDTVHFGDRSFVVHGAVAHGESSPSTFGRSV
jgi:hypothetical protein